MTETAQILLGVIAGLVLLTAGSDRLVWSASGLALKWGISPLVIGLTVVAYGTSTPEMAVSAFAAWRGSADVAVGNVVGSNIFNIFFILGLCAAIVPLTVSSQIVRLDVPVAVLASVAVLWMAGDGKVGAVEGAMLLAAAVIYTVFIVRKSRSETAAIKEEYDSSVGPSGSPLWILVLTVVVSLGLLVLGTRLFVDNAIVLARQWGVSELVIGLTLVAAGTSMPEVFTSLIATLKGHRDIAVGNVVGSSIYNLLAILGLSAVVSGGSGITVSDTMLGYDLPVMLWATVLCLPVVLTGMRLSRAEGVLFIGLYGVYLLMLYLDAVGHPWAAGSRSMVTGVLMPALAVVCGIPLLARALQRHPKEVSDQRR